MGEVASAADTPQTLHRPRLELTATLVPADARVSGSLTLSIPNTSAVALTDVRLWLYPNHLADRSEALGDVNFHWLYPDGFSRADIRIANVRVNEQAAPVSIVASSEGAATVAIISLPSPLPPGQLARIELSFVTQLPTRLGNFGCYKGQCRLMGGFYPSPLHLGPKGFEEAAPLDRVDIVADIDAPAAADVFVDGTRRSRAQGPVHVESSNVPYLGVISDQRLDVDTVSVGALTARYFHPDKRPPSSADEVLPYVREDRAGLILDTIASAFQFLSSRGLLPSDDLPLTTYSSPHALTLVQAPLRHELVRTHGDVILVSDRIFEIFPVDSLRRYHRLELARAVFTSLMVRASKHHEPDPDVELAADCLAAHFTERFTLNTFREMKFARELLRPLAFIPAVDQLMYAPLVASSASYFGEITDRQGLRDDLRQFSHHRLGGRALYAKLQDLLGAAGVDRMVHQMLHEHIPLRKAAATEFGGELAWFWNLGFDDPAPAVNYRLVSVKVDRSPGDRRSAHVTIDLARQTEMPSVRERVEVRATDRDGAEHNLVWFDSERSHRFELDLPAGLASVEIDPRQRLNESAVGALSPEDDPRTDNRIPRRWRLVYNGFGALLDATALTAAFAAAVTLKPQHDLRNEFLFLADHSPAVLGGLRASYERRFGKQADRNRLTTGAGVGLSAARLNPHFGVAENETSKPGWVLAGSLFLEHDDRDFFIDPWTALGIDASLGYAITALDDGRRLGQLNVGASVVRLFELAPGHVLAANVDAAATFGDIQRRSQLLRLGGSFGLRGYGVDELLGRGRAVARLELRDRYVSDLDWNLGHFTAVRGLAGNLFVETGLIAGCSELSVSKSDVFYDVGYSFRVLHDAWGVYQQMLSIDLAVPLNRHIRECTGAFSQGAGPTIEPSTKRPPFVVLISFLPAF